MLVGNAAFLGENGVDVRPLETATGAGGRAAQTPVLVAVDGRAAGMIAIADPVRPTSREAVRQLLALGLEVVMLTGDDERTARAVAREVGIERVVAQVLPSAKLAVVEGLKAEGKVVAMVGDGINDAPALAAADVGIAIGTGTDVAIEAADIALMRPDLRRRGARRSAWPGATMRTIRQNLFWAFVYNMVGIPVAAGALYPAFGILLTPTMGAAAMALFERVGGDEQPAAAAGRQDGKAARRCTFPGADTMNDDHDFRPAPAAPPNRRAPRGRGGPEIKKAVLLRLRRIEGQVRGLQRMVEEERYCADIITQVASVHEALRGTARALLQNHLRHCATTAIRSGDAAAAEAMYEELIDLVGKAR